MESSRYALYHRIARLQCACLRTGSVRHTKNKRLRKIQIDGVVKEVLPYNQSIALTFTFYFPHLLSRYPFFQYGW